MLEQTQTEVEYSQKQLRLKVATRQATFYKDLEASLNRNWKHVDHPLLQKIGIADYLLGFQLKCKKPRDTLTEEIMGLMIQLGITGDDDDE